MPALLAAAIVPVRRAVVDAGGVRYVKRRAVSRSTSYIPGLRRAGDFQTAAGMARGEVIVHGAGDAFRVTGIRVERARLSPREIAELAGK